MTSIVWPLIFWLCVIEFPLAFVQVRSSMMVYQKSKKQAQTVNVKNIPWNLFLEQNSSLLKDTTLYGYSIKKMFHIGLIVVLSFIITKEPLLLLFLGFAVLGFLQDFEDIRLEQYNKITSITTPASPLQPAGLTSSSPHPKL